MSIHQEIFKTNQTKGKTQNIIKQILYDLLSNTNTRSYFADASTFFYYKLVHNLKQGRGITFLPIMWAKGQQLFL